MAVTVDELLTNAREHLRALGNGVVALANGHPDVFDDPRLTEQVQAFLAAYEEAQERLENPTLSIATLGTTSSGKSTIVNALVGRRIAPIEAGEMSGGVLRLRVSDESRLIIEETDNASWETGEWHGLDDAELYDRIQQTMRTYHDTRKQLENCIAPQITVYGPLLPASDRSLLDLPSGIDLEIIDLPGLKSTQDRANLAVIQPQLSRACSLVALDYGQVDEEHRQHLLKELKEVVTFLNGSTDSTIFVLNRVDMRGSDDLPLEQRIEKLKGEIQSILGLREVPIIIPFSARLLYYAQCAWGTRSRYRKSTVNPNPRRELIRSMLQDCASTIREFSRSNKEIRNWIRDIEDAVEDGEAIDDKTMDQLLNHALNWSGGEELWQTLQNRLQDSFAQLVLVPILRLTLSTFDSLIQSVLTIAKNRQLDSKKAVEDKLESIAQSRRALERAVTSQRQDFEGFIRETQRDLTANSPKSRDQAVKRAKNRGLEGFKRFRDAVDLLKDDLTDKLLIPIRSTLNDGDSSFGSDNSAFEAFELEDELSEAISPVIAREIARSFARVKGSWSIIKPQKAQGVYSARARVDRKSDLEKLEKLEQAYRRLYQATSNGLSRRAEFVLQAQINLLKEVLQGFAEQECSKVIEQVNEKLYDSTLKDALEAEFRLIVEEYPPQIPEDFFRLTQNITVSTETKQEHTGTRQVQYEVEHRFLLFFKWKEIKHRDDPIYQDFEYRELQLPDFKNMIKKWNEDIENKEQALWEVICQWTGNYLESMSRKFAEGIERVFDLTDRSLQQQKRIIEQDFAEEQQRWQKITSHRNELLTIRQKLRDLTFYGSQCK